VPDHIYWRLYPIVTFRDWIVISCSVLGFKGSPVKVDELLVEMLVSLLDLVAICVYLLKLSRKLW
jgi:hypothetical protein